MAAENVPRSIQQTQRSMNIAEMLFMMVITMKMRRKSGYKKQQDTMGHCIFPRFLIMFDQDLQLQIYYGRIESCCI
jgi:hypothetical protein